MKNKFLFLLIAFFALRFDLHAATVTQATAQSVALNFFKVTLGSNLPRTPVTANLVYTKTESDGIVDFYVYNMSPVTGFVIVAADDNDEPIIGYSTESSFHTNFSNIGLSNWLNRWSEEIHYVALNNVVASVTASTNWAAYKQGIAAPIAKASSVLPLLGSIAWSQSSSYGYSPALYNNYCPGSGQNQCVTGCVATAMAQIMKYWNYPTKGIGSSSYNDSRSNGFTDNNGTLSFNYGTTTFDWAHMPNGLNNSSSTTQINAIGTLMYACGVSVDMDYDPNGSGSIVLTQQAGGWPCAQTSYVNYFGYQSSIWGQLLSLTTSATLLSDIQTDLNASRPVQMQGTDQTYGGHSWVCDGYNSSNQLHMNWGWDGYSNGYFALTSMNPNDGSGTINFSTDIGALLGIQPPPGSNITVSATVGSTSICSGSRTTVTAHGPTGATYAWSPTTGLSCSTCASTTATVAATTIYTVTADSAGVTATATVTVSVNAAIVPGAGSTTNVSCYGGSGGALTITATGGSGGFTYHWSSGQTTATISNLSAGTYTVTITDVKGCTATASKAVSQPGQMVGTITPTSASCGSSNGQATVSVSGGVSSYSYRWSNNSTFSTITGLAAGSYSVTITDSHSCTASATTTVSGGGNLSALVSATNINCYGTSTGSVTASASGGSGNVQYAWSNGGNTATLNNIPAGNYVVTISDGTGCSTTASKTVTQPSSAVTVSVTPANASCNHANGSATAAASGGISGYSYNWNTGASSPGISGLGAGTYQVTVHDANGCSTSAAVTLISSSGLNAIATATAVACHGGSNGSITLSISGGSGNLTYTWSNGGNSATISNLSQGNYTATVSDASGCSATITQAISQPSAINISMLPSGAACGGSSGSVTASVTGGNSGYHYAWSNGGNGSSISNLGAGTYNLTVSDNAGCTATAAAVVTNSGSLVLDPSINNVTCYGQTNGSATVSAANGASPYTFAWSNGGTSNTISNLISGMYIVTVTDAHSCSSSVSINVTQPAVIAITTSTIGCSANQNNGSAAVINVTGGNGSYTYVWSNGENGQTINNLSSGTYTVTVSDRMGCQNTAQALVTGATGMNDVNNPISFSMYPNPAASEIVVAIANVNGAETTLSIRNILGQQLMFRPLAEAQTTVDVSTLTNGVYLVELRQGDKSAVRQLVVNK